MTTSPRPSRRAGHRDCPRAVRHLVSVAVAGALGVGTLGVDTLLAGCAPGDHGHHLADDGPPAALHADPSAKAAGEVAVYVLGVYSEAVAGGTPRPDPSLEWQTGWDNTSDLEMVSTEYLIGGTVEGGRFLRADVTSVVETGHHEYEVRLTARREAQAFRASTGALVARLPACELSPTVIVTHLGARWRVDRLLLLTSDAERQPRVRLTQPGLSTGAPNHLTDPPVRR